MAVVGVRRIVDQDTRRSFLPSSSTTLDNSSRQPEPLSFTGAASTNRLPPPGPHPGRRTTLGADLRESAAPCGSVRFLAVPRGPLRCVGSVSARNRSGVHSLRSWVSQFAPWSRSDQARRAAERRRQSCLGHHSSSALRPIVFGLNRWASFSKGCIARWRHEYDTFRPHSSLGYRPPAPETRILTTNWRKIA